MAARPSVLDQTTVIGYLLRGVRKARFVIHEENLSRVHRPADAEFGSPVKRHSHALLVKVVLLFGLALASVACQPAKSPGQVRSPRAQQWFDRAQASFQQMDVDDAQDAIAEAMRFAPMDVEVRLLAANIALAKLDYAETVRVTEGLTDSKALALRGRAQWYDGDVQGAGASVEALLRDPEVHDPWAKAISQLANRGAGRKPYRTEGHVVAAVEMPRVRGTALIVPIEVDGEAGLALVATGTAEVVLDRARRQEPSWVSIRIDERAEFQDVPAVTQDLSGISRQLGAPIKAMLGVNFLRHANATFDFQAQQFVVRQFSPPRPPRATDVPLYYVRGGGMMIRSALRADTSPPPASLLIDSSQMFPLSLDAEGWGKAGVDANTLKALEGEPGVRHGMVPMIRIGAFDVPQVAGVLGAEIEPLERALGLDIDGIVGSGLLGGFRITIGDSGRTLWVEEDFVEPPPAPHEPAEGDAPSEGTAPPMPGTSDTPSLQLPTLGGGTGTGGVQAPGGTK
jgi:hypothetical protein